MLRDDKHVLPMKSGNPERLPVVMQGEMVVGCPIEDTLVLVLGIGSLTAEQATVFSTAIRP
jgi:hypothetical protein